MTFKIGSRVRLKPDSLFHYQNYGVGTVISYKTYTSSLWYTIRWDFPFFNDRSRITHEKGLYEDGYPIEDVVLAEIRNTKLARKLYPNAKEEGGWLRL